MDAKGTRIMFGTVPMLPTVIPLTIAVFLSLLSALRRRQQLTLPRVAIAAALAVYAGGIVANTVFPIYLALPKNDGPRPLPLNLVPFLGYEAGDALTNGLLFLPLGVIVPMVLTSPTWWRVLAVAAGAGLVTEITQFFTSYLCGGGHVADINDWLSNSLGAATGFACLRLASKHHALGELVDRFRWSPRVQAAPDHA